MRPTLGRLKLRLAAQHQRPRSSSTAPRPYAMRSCRIHPSPHPCASSASRGRKRTDFLKRMSRGAHFVRAHRHNACAIDALLLLSLRAESAPTGVFVVRREGVLIPPSPRRSPSPLKPPRALIARFSISTSLNQLSYVRYQFAHLFSKDPPSYDGGESPHPTLVGQKAAFPVATTHLQYL